MSNRDRLGIKGVLCLVTAVVGLVIGSSPATAGSPIVYNQSGKYVAMRWAPTPNAGVDRWLPNSQHFYMRCWVDNHYFNGNYGSVRWFGGYSQSGYWGYVHSSYVYHQQSVGRC